MRAHFAVGWAVILLVASACSDNSTVAPPDGGGGGSSGSAISSSSGSSGSGSSGSSSSGGSGASSISLGGSSSSGVAGGTSSGSSSSGANSGSGGISGNGDGGGSGSAAAHDGGPADAGLGGEDTDAGRAEAGALPYPSGPYCAPATPTGHMATGCVIPNLTWNGYVDDAADALATTKPYRSYSLGDVYNDAHVSGKRYAMVNIAEFQCPGCQNSAKELGALVGDGSSIEAAQMVVQAGGVLIEVLMTDGFTKPATMPDLMAWITKYSLDVTSVADLDPTTPTLNTLGRRDQAYIIDLTTMKVLQYIDGSVGSTGTTGMNSGSLGMAAMHTLLGK